MSNTDTPETGNSELDLKILRASTQDAIVAATKLRTLIRKQYRGGFMTAEDYWEAVKMLSLIDAHADKAIYDTGLWLARRDVRTPGGCEQRLLDVLEGAGKALGPTELAEATGMSRNSVSTYLGRMVEKQLIVKEDRGIYRLPSADDLE